MPQRGREASIRRQKYHCLADTELGDKEKLLTDQIRLNITREQYLRFSRAAGLPTQNERAQVAGFGRSEASKASAAYRKQNDTKAMVNITGATAQDIASTIEAELKLMPIKHRALAETMINRINVTDNSKLSGYRISTKEIELSTKSSPYTIIHEYAHALERALDIYSDPKFLKVRDNILQGLLIDDIVEDTTTFTEPIIRVVSPRLISEYQGRIYKKYGFKGDNMLNGMREYFSEGYREYIINPNNLKKHDTDLFNYMEAIPRE